MILKWFGLFNSISTLYWLYNAQVWFTYKCLITIYILTVPLQSFLKLYFFLFVCDNHSFAYSYMVWIICTQFYGFKCSYLILIVYIKLYGFKQLFLFNNDNHLFVPNSPTEGKSTFKNKCLEYDTKLDPFVKSHVLELWRVWSQPFIDVTLSFHSDLEW